MEDNKKDNENLDVLFKQLEELIVELGKNDVSLEQSFTLYNQGMDAIKKCSETIDTIEKKVQVIDQNGEFHEF